MPRQNDVETIKSFLDDLWKQAQGMLTKGKRRTEEVAHAAKIKMDMYLLTSKKGDLYQKLGEDFYTSSKRRKPSVKKQQKLFSVIQEIRDIEAHEKSLKKALKKGRPAEKKVTRRGRPPGRKPARLKKQTKPTA